MLAKHRKTLLVIVAEAVLERALVRDIAERGVQGWTVHEVHGRGFEGLREGDWEADRTVEIKVIADAAVADAIAEHVLASYAANYGVSMWFGEVAVLRPERF